MHTAPILQQVCNCQQVCYHHVTSFKLAGAAILKYSGASKFERRDVMIFRGTLCRTLCRTQQTASRLRQGAGLFCTQQETSKRRQTRVTIHAGSNDVVCLTRLLSDHDLKEMLKQRRGIYSSEFSQRVLFLPMMLQLLVQEINFRPLFHAGILKKSSDSSGFDTVTAETIGVNCVCEARYNEFNLENIIIVSRLIRHCTSEKKRRIQHD